MTGFNVPVSVQHMIDELPPGLERAILRVLSFHIGRAKAISRQDLIGELLNHGFDYRKEDRPVRLAINQMRKQGHPICSTGGIGGGYFLAVDWAELNEYLQAEIHARAMDLLEQEKAMRDGGSRLWGSQSQQISMF